MRFIVACDRYNISWRRYDGELIQTSIGNYRPDFIADIDKKIIEIKGYLNSDSLIKIKAAKQHFGDKHYVILEEQLQHFENTGQITSANIEELSIS